MAKQKNIIPSLQFFAARAMTQQLGDLNNEVAELLIDKSRDYWRCHALLGRVNSLLAQVQTFEEAYFHYSEADFMRAIKRAKISFAGLFVLGGIRYFLSQIEGYEQAQTAVLATMIATIFLGSRYPNLMIGLLSESERQFNKPVEDIKKITKVIDSHDLKLLANKLSASLSKEDMLSLLKRIKAVCIGVMRQLDSTAENSSHCSEKSLKPL